MEGQNGMDNEEEIDKIFNLHKEIYQNKDHSSNETNEGQNSKDREEENLGTENIREIEKDMDRDERTKSDVEEQTSAIEELKRMHKDTDKGGGAGYFGKRKSREKWSEKRKSSQNQRQPATEIEAMPVENSIVIYCFSQVLHFLTDSIRYFAIFSSTYALFNIDK